jgi:hypothetical protein
MHTLKVHKARVDLKNSTERRRQKLQGIAVGDECGELRAGVVGQASCRSFTAFITQTASVGS